MSDLVIPRDYQIDCIKQVFDVFTHHNRCMLVAPTGAGKTLMAILVATEAIKKGIPVYFVVHMDVLVDQTAQEFEKFGFRCGIVAGGRKENRSCPVQVISFQTLGGEKRDLSWLMPPGKKLTIADECHETSFVKVMLDRFPWLVDSKGAEVEGWYLGLTGTPWRSKRDESMGLIFSKMVKAPMPGELIRMGYLVKPVYYRIKNSPMGDMQADIDYIIEKWEAIAQRSPTLVFTSSVHFATEVAKRFNERGISSESVSGSTSKCKRRKIFKAFDNDEVTVLASCNALSIGFDKPKARVGVFARGTESPQIFFQQLGRILRTYRNKQTGYVKTDAIVLDQMNLIRRFGIVDHLDISEDVLDMPESRIVGQVPMKECDNCGAYNYLSFLVCTECGKEFDIVGKIRHKPTGEMERYFAESEERAQFSFYQRQLLYAFRDEKPPEYADLKFLKKYRKYPPHDWRRNAVLKNGTEEEKQAYREYLLKTTAKTGSKRSHQWIEGQLSLELGI